MTDNTTTTRKIALAWRGVIEDAIRRYNLPDGEAIVRLLLMIAAHESGMFLYCRQVRGPALGVFQMEPATYQATLDYIKRTGKFPSLPTGRAAERMSADGYLAAAMARVYLWSFPEPLPEPDDIRGLAEYAKKYWNTAAGAATAHDYEQAYLEAWGTEGAAA